MNRDQPRKRYAVGAYSQRHNGIAYDLILEGEADTMEGAHRKAEAIGLGWRECKVHIYEHVAEMEVKSYMRPAPKPTTAIAPLKLQRPRCWAVRAWRCISCSASHERRIESLRNK